MPPIAAPDATFSPPLARPSFPPSSAMPLPIPPNALALEPPPVASSSIRTQIFWKIRLLAPEAEPLPIPYYLNIQPHQTLLAYMHYRSLQAKLPSDLLLLMTLKHPATWFWFQKHQVHSTAIRHPITPTTPSACLPASDPGTRPLDVRGLQDLHLVRSLSYQRSSPNPHQPIPLMTVHHR